MMKADKRSAVVCIALVALACYTADTSAQDTTTLPGPISDNTTVTTSEPVATSAATTITVETMTIQQSDSKSTTMESGVTQASTTESTVSETAEASTESTTIADPPPYSETSEAPQNTVAPAVTTVLQPGKENRDGANLTPEGGSASPDTAMESESSSSKVGGIVAGVMAAVVAAAAGYFAYYKKKFCFEPSDSEVGQSHGAKGAAQNDHQGATALLETAKEGGQ
ncbi:uncharacterized protein LOC116942979 [Petromyzon marinus]|uniref:Flocculation protein FLO11-like n=1 Tax=Petromyzon marinus TaxID=7757 RepID=A0AAJ7T767_PETMA|nr:flocculation protein FLO11-like [Petromyzon marinus]XP_032811414.1 flocculation protein FLO11-like [Petromyzon marinus]